MMDVKGPEIRTGRRRRADRAERGRHVRVLTPTAPSDGVRGVAASTTPVCRGRRVGATVLVDSGLIRLEVVEKDETHVRCRVLTPGHARLAAAHQPARRRRQPAVAHREGRARHPRRRRGGDRLRRALVRPPQRRHPRPAGAARQPRLQGADHRQDRGPERRCATWKTSSESPTPSWSPAATWASRSTTTSSAGAAADRRELPRPRASRSSSPRTCSNR